ncbi:hypothetical protein BGZ54_006037 [Gamsiella multidivaricata]|nr:hypothetical protein BGZ54_006037 [Gamsiella multidivaricata]
MLTTNRPFPKSTTFVALFLLSLAVLSSSSQNPDFYPSSGALVDARPIGLTKRFPQTGGNELEGRLRRAPHTPYSGTTQPSLDKGLQTSDGGDGGDDDASHDLEPVQDTDDEDFGDEEEDRDSDDVEPIVIEPLYRAQDLFDEDEDRDEGIFAEGVATAPGEGIMEEEDQDSDSDDDGYGHGSLWHGFGQTSRLGPGSAHNAASEDGPRERWTALDDWLEEEEEEEEERDVNGLDDIMDWVEDLEHVRTRNSLRNGGLREQGTSNGANPFRRLFPASWRA